MSSIASGMGGSSARGALLPSMRFAYGPLVLPDEGGHQVQSGQSGALRGNQMRFA